MRRIWLGIGILTALLAAGLWAQWEMQALNLPIAQELERASAFALAENWEAAQALAENAVRQWEANRGKTASLADHSPMDEVDLLLAELDVYGVTRETPHFAACCTQLSRMVRAIGQAHVFNWWNVL